MSIYADKAQFFVNGKPLDYVGDAPEINEGYPEIKTTGTLSGRAIHVPDYSSAYTTITINVTFSQENRQQIRDIQRNGNNNICQYRDQEFRGCILAPLAKSDGKEVTLTFTGDRNV
jgi:serine kinase of HPr protein (carbohydrate metabolism regulator)